MLNDIWKHRLRIYFIAISGLFCAFFFCKPHNSVIQAVTHSPSIIKFESLIVKKNNLTDNLTRYSPELHEAKGVFRLTIPVLMKVFNITSLPQLYVFQILIGILLYFIMAALAYQASGSYKVALVSIIALSATYFGRAFFLDTYPWLDTFGFFFAVLAIWARKYFWVTIPATIALFFTDERGAVCTAVVFLTIKLFDLPQIGDVTFRNLFTFKGYSNNILIGVFVAICIRLILMLGFGMATPTGEVGYLVFLNQWKAFQLGLFDGMVGLWGLFFITMLHALLHKKWLWAAIVVSCILVFVAISASVHDVTRSIVYVVPLVFICIKYLRQNLTDLGYILASIAFINLMMPHGFVIKDWIFNNTGYPMLYDIVFKAMSVLGIH